MIRTYEISILGGTDTRKFFKDGRKVSRIVIAHHLGNGINVDIGAAQQFFRPVYADLIDVIRQRNVCGLFEGPA